MTKPNKTTEQEDQTSSKLSFLRELQELINKHSKENDSDTPDFILAQYLNNCLAIFNLTQKQRSDMLDTSKKPEEEAI